MSEGFIPSESAHDDGESAALALLAKARENYSKEHYALIEQELHGGELTGRQQAWAKLLIDDLYRQLSADHPQTASAAVTPASNADFIPERGPVQMSTKQAETREFTTDIPAYAPEVAAIAGKLAHGDKVHAHERAAYDRARERWWKEKYGFPYDRGAERKALLERKYAVSEDFAERRALAERFFAAVESGDAAALAAVKAAYVERYPDQLEGLTALLELPGHIDNQRYLAMHPNERDPKVRKEVMRRIEETTQYHFLLTHFLLESGSDKEFLTRFWDTIEKLAEAKGNIKVAHSMRRGVLSQVATHRIFEQLGMHPELSHPKEDAFEKTDLWVDSSRVQVKGTKERGDEMFVETDAIDFPNATVQRPDGSLARYSSKLMHEAQKFSKKVPDGEKGYFAVVPYHEIDFVTGEPSKEIVARSAKSLGVKAPQ